MPQPNITSVVVLKANNGGQTTVMQQPQVESYLGNLVGNNRTASLKQAINDVFNANGKATGAYTFNNAAVWHASSGNGQQSVSVFFRITGAQAELFAMGAHATTTSYKITDFGQAGTDFAEGKTISL